MTPNTTPPTRFIGCDVGKHTIVVFDADKRSTRSIPNKKPDLERFARTLDDTCLVVCEATGGYESRLLDALLRHARACHRADARKVKAFIRSFGTLGKSDAIDAEALARYGAERHDRLARWAAPEPRQAELQSLVSVRTDLVRMRQAQRNRLQAPGAAAVAATLRALIQAIARELRTIEARIAKLIQSHPGLRRDREALCGIKGIGEVTAAALLALMPELGTLNAKHAAALAGVAPHPHQSGTRDGYRRTRGGRPEVKRTLFMAALVAAHAEGPCGTAYQRLISNGKKPIVAVVAIMRKLIVIANARLRDAHHVS